MSVERIEIRNESLRTTAEIVSPIVSPASEAISQKLCFQPKSKAASARTTRQTQTRVSATPVSSAGHTKTLDGQQHVRRAHRDTERGPQDHSLDLLVRSEESPCKNTDAPRASAKFSRRHPRRLSPRLSLRLGRLSLKSCASSPRARQPPAWRSHDVPGCASKSQTNAHDCDPKHDDARTTKSLSDDQRAKDRM